VPRKGLRRISESSEVGDSKKLLGHKEWPRYIPTNGSVPVLGEAAAEALSSLSVSGTEKSRQQMSGGKTRNI